MRSDSLLDEIPRFQGAVASCDVVNWPSSQWQEIECLADILRWIEFREGFQMFSLGITSLASGREFDDGKENYLEFGTDIGLGMDGDIDFDRAVDLAR